MSKVITTANIKNQLVYGKDDNNQPKMIEFPSESVGVLSTEIPSMGLISSMFSYFYQQLNQLSGIFGLKEMRYIGESTTLPTSGYVTIDGIVYETADLDNGNYIVYQNKAYILNHGIWNTYTPESNIPEGSIYNKHVAESAEIAMSKIGGLNDKLSAMEADYKQFDIQQSFKEISGNISNTIFLNINGVSCDLGLIFNQEITNISGDITNNINTSIAGQIQNLSTLTEQRLKNVTGDITTNNNQLINLSSQFANVVVDIREAFNAIQGQINNNNSVGTQIDAVKADVQASIDTYINQLTGNFVQKNDIGQEVAAQVAQLNTQIQNILSEVIAEYIQTDTTVHQSIEAEQVDIKNEFVTYMNRVSASILQNSTELVQNISANIVSIINNSNSVIANCNFGVASFNVNDTNSTIVHYVKNPNTNDGTFASLQDASNYGTQSYQIGGNVIGQFPELNGDNELVATEKTFETVSLFYLNPGDVVRVTDANAHVTSMYILDSITDNDRNSISNFKWKPLYEDSKIQIVETVPASNQMVDNVLYFVLEAEE